MKSHHIFFKKKRACRFRVLLNKMLRFEVNVFALFWSYKVTHLIASNSRSSWCAVSGHLKWMRTLGTGSTTKSTPYFVFLNEFRIIFGWMCGMHQDVLMSTFHLLIKGPPAGDQCSWDKCRYSVRGYDSQLVLLRVDWSFDWGTSSDVAPIRTPNGFVGVRCGFLTTARNV